MRTYWCPLELIVLYCIVFSLSSFVNFRDRIVAEVASLKVKAHVSLVSAKKKALIFEFLLSCNTTEISDKTHAGIGGRFSDYSLVYQLRNTLKGSSSTYSQPSVNCSPINDILYSILQSSKTSRRQLQFLAQSHLIDFSIPELSPSWWPNMQRLIVLATVTLFIVTTWWIRK